MTGVSHETLYGKEIWEPGASFRTDYDTEGDANSKHYNDIVVLGSGCKRGDPNPAAMLKFNDSSFAKKIIGAGNVLELMKKCWAPSTAPEIIGANYIYFLRVGSPEQSTLALTNGVVTVLTATSVDYGVDMNNIRIKVENGSSVVGSKRVYVYKLDDDGRPQVQDYDNLKNSFEIQYTGSGTDAKITIATASDLATTLTTSVTGEPADNLNITLSDTNYNTLGKLINYINGLDAYTCSIPTGADSLMNTNLMDAAAAVDIDDAIYTHTAVLGSIIHVINRYNTLISVERATAQTAAPQNIAYTYMAGGTDNGGVITTQDYTDALTKIEEEGLGMGAILIESISNAVHRAVGAWAKLQRESDLGRWKVFCGHAHAETAAQVQTRSYGLNNIDVVLASPGVKILDDNDELQTYNSTYYAAMLCGQYVGSGLDQPLTNNTIPIDGLATKYDVLTRESLIKSGTCITKWDRSIRQYVTVYAVTTYTQSDERFYRVLFPNGEVDHVEWNIKQGVEATFKGKKARTSTPGSIASYVQSLLSKFENIEEILVRNPADPASVAYTSPRVTISGGVARIVFTGFYSDEMDFFDIAQTAKLQKLESVITADIQ